MVVEDQIDRTRSIFHISDYKLKSLIDFIRKSNSSINMNDIINGKHSLEKLDEIFKKSSTYKPELLKEMLGELIQCCLEEINNNENGNIRTFLLNKVLH